MACVCQGAPRNLVEHCPGRKVRLREDVHAVGGSFATSAGRLAPDLALRLGSKLAHLLQSRVWF